MAFALETGRRWALAGLVTNLILAVVKISAGIVGHSYALIADGLESSLDMLGSALIWAGLKYASKNPDTSHPYGHGKAEPLAALFVALGLMGFAVLLAGASIQRILHPESVPEPFTLGVLVLVIAIKESLFRVVHRIGVRLDSNAIKADAWHHRSDAITSVATLIGVTIAVVGGKAWASADGWAALVACVFIGWNAGRIFFPALAEILDTAPEPAALDAIRATAASVPGVFRLDLCRMRKMGLDFYVDLHIIVDGRISVADGHRIAHEVKDAIRNAHKRVCDVMVHVEPGASADLQSAAQDT